MYIYLEIHVPPMVASHREDIHLIAVPPPAVGSENRRGGRRGNATTWCVGRSRMTCKYKIHTYIHIDMGKGA
jgi:hypothetical protein